MTRHAYADLVADRWVAMGRTGCVVAVGSKTGTGMGGAGPGEERSVVRTERVANTKRVAVRLKGSSPRAVNDPGEAAR